MRVIAIAVILASLPVFIVMLQQYRAYRDWALFALGLMLFMVGTLQIDAALVTWNLWQGISRGVFISPLDTLSLALIVTRQDTGERIRLLWLMILYMLPASASLMVSYMPMASFFIAWQILRITIMFYALAGEIRRPRALQSLFAGLSAGLIMQGALVIEQKVSGVIQAKGSTDHQNILGMMVEMAAIPLMALILEGDRRKVAYAGIVAALVIVAGGGSRATMGFAAAGLASVLILSLVRNATPRKLKFLGLSVIAFLIFAPLGAATLMDRFGERSITVEDQERPAFERAAKAMASDHPFGVGANNYVMVANEQGYSQRPGVSWGGGNLAAPVHNSYLLMRAETGWAGEGIMLLMLLFPIASGLWVGLTQRKRPMLGLALGSATAAAVASLHANFEYAWHLEAVQRLFFVNLAVLSACLTLRRRLPRRQARPTGTEDGSPGRMQRMLRTSTRRTTAS